MREKPLIVGASISDKYYSDTVCPCCRGKKYASSHDEIKVGGLSIGEYMITPFADLLKVNKAIRKHSKSASLTFALDAIDTFLQRAIDLILDTYSSIVLSQRFQAENFSDCVWCRYLTLS